MEINLSKKPVNRINYIDFLKFIGLTGIIIAHVGAPSWVMMLRSFDVPFMVIISSILASKSFSKYEKSHSSIIHYYVTRAKRLVLPTWLFLLLYFLLMYITTKKAESIKYYIASFGLTRYGIGYVWIILIYLYSAMLIPLFARIKLSIKGIVIVSVTYIIYEIAYYKIGLSDGILKNFIDTTFYYIIPYGVLTYLGYNYSSMKKKTKCIIVLISLIVFTSLAIYYYISMGKLQLVEIAKYPPRIYYLSYGIACSFVLLLLCEKYDNKIYCNKIMRFISTHSLWIYLWHILVLFVYDKLKLSNVWFVKLIIVYTISIIVVIVVNKFLDLLEKSHKVSFLKYLRG